MYGKAYNVRDVRRILSNNGYVNVRNSGGHCIFKNEDGNVITITNSKISQKTWKRECKKNNIVE